MKKTPEKKAEIEERKKRLLQKTSVLLENIVNDNLKGDGQFDVGSILDLMNERGFGFIFVLFGIIGILALPPLSTFAAIPMLFFSTQFFLDYSHPYLPKSIMNKKFQKSSMRTAMEKSVSALERVERIVKPRLSFCFYGGFERFLGFMMIIFSTSVLLPIPLTNFLPSIALVFIGLGMIERDGLMTIIGIVLGILGVSLTISIFFVGAEFIDYMLNKP